MEYKRLLVISNGAMDESDSNGRTLRNFIVGWDKAKLAQFYMYGTPDFNVCSKYYKVSDKDALLSCILKKKAAGSVTPYLQQNQQSTSLYTGTKKVKKTPFTALLRELVWSDKRWKKSFCEWVEKFRPEVILVFMGDTSFILNTAMDLAEKYRIPLVVYSCEYYYFKEYNYLTKKPSALYGLFHKKYVCTVRRLASAASQFIFINKALMRRYQEEFPNIKADFVMTASELKDLALSNGNLITYAGNMGHGRHKALIQVGDALQSIDRSLKITVFSATCNREVEDEIRACKGIDYRGAVPYCDVVEAIKNSRLLLHVEYSDTYAVKDLKYGFSTKLSDCITSGVPLFCYAPKELTFTAFLAENKCAFLAFTKEELVDKLKTALYNQPSRNSVVEHASITAKQYFDAEKNRKKFQTILLSAGNTGDLK